MSEADLEASAGDDLDFMQGSMKDLVMKMGEIDDVLAEITAEPSNEEGETKGGEDNSAKGKEGNEEPKEDVFKETDKSAPVASKEEGGGDENVLPSPTKAADSSGTSADLVTDDDEDDSEYDSDKESGGLTDLQGELKQFEEMDRYQADAVIRAASVNINAKDVTVNIIKKSPTSPVGLSMKTSQRITRIVAISEQGLLFNTKLRVGQILVKINGISIKNAKHARYVIQNAPDKVKFEAKEIEEENGGQS